MLDFCRFNQSPYPPDPEDPEAPVDPVGPERRSLLQEIFGIDESQAGKLLIEPPFFCDYVRYDVDYNPKDANGRNSGHQYRIRRRILCKHKLCCLGLCEGASAWSQQKHDPHDEI